MAIRAVIRRKDTPDSWRADEIATIHVAGHGSYDGCKSATSYDMPPHM
jgi:hypothetical protein